MSLGSERKTKAVAKRIDLSYPTQPSPMRTLRRVLVIVCALAAAAWGGYALVAKSERIYNPGPVAAVHASFESDCWRCHDGGRMAGGRTATTAPAGGTSHGWKFSKGVSDAACLKCHDGAIHADKQISLVSTKDGKPAMSSDCVACHVEHKGDAAMAGMGDALCLRCHENLSANVAGGSTAMAVSVRAFDEPPAHPPFGRVLKQGGERAVDPTPLKFNHKKHLADINPSVGDCSTCHHLSPSGARRIMQPVSFEAHCKSCHPLSLAANLPEVPHERMEIVRLFTSNLPASFAQRVSTMTPEERKAALTITTEKRVGIRVVKETKEVSEPEWIEAQTKELLEKKVAGSAAAKQPAYQAIGALEPATTKNAAALELYAAYGMTTSCSYCHTLSGAPAGVAKSAGELLRAEPTGFTFEATAAATAAAATRPSTAHPLPTREGRRWFTGSVFDHDAHRGMTCVECHAKASGSMLTSDMLVPDADACVRCHHPGGRGGMAASNNCVTCHVYHDRAKETPR
jgi:predicted CXXCH cytochrome family protein